MFNFPIESQVYATDSGTQLTGDSRELLALLPADSIDLGFDREIKHLEQPPGPAGSWFGSTPIAGRSSSQ